MKIKFIDAKYTKEIEFTNLVEALKSRKIKSIALYTTTQFLEQIEKLELQLKKEKIEVLSSKPARADKKYQVLGCDVYPENFNLNKKEYSDVGAIVYVGTGEFHPSALLFALQKDVLCFNPLSKKIQTLSKTSEEIKKVLGRKQAASSKFILSNKIGVIITTKPGQSYPNYTEQIKKNYPDKEVYSFVCDTIDFNEMENFPFIQVWVNTACPRIGLEDLEKSRKPIVNVHDIL